MTPPPKQGGVPICEQCRRPCFGEVFKLTHQEMEGAEVDEAKTFCSRTCLDEYFEVLYLDKVNQAVRKEVNFLTKLVCPSCRRRVRQHG